MRRVLALVLLAALAVPARAGRPLTAKATEFPEDAAWANAKPLTLKRLRGRRVILLAFINTASVHALRAIQQLKKLDQAYSLEGLIVIGVHTPAYAFQKNPAVVQAELRRWGVEFPVVLDNERKLWNAYANEGWPGFYLIDHRGRVIWDLVGETRYGELEAELREAIDRAPGYGKPEFPPVLKDPPTRDCGTATNEVDLGGGRGNILDLERIDEPLSSIITAARSGEMTRKGAWLADGDGLRLNQSNRDQSAFVRIIYVGSQAFATLSPGAAGRARFFVRQDELFMDSGNAGKDISFDEEGRSFVVADKPRLYHLANNARDQARELTISPVGAGSVVYGFGFSDQCLKLDF